jgi:hypothetical protein
MRAQIVLFAVSSVLTVSCALNVRPSMSPAEMSRLWMAPADLERRDLFAGPGGQRRAPANGGRYDFVDVKTSGTQPGYDVRDSGGREWSVKLGDEARAEVTVSRLVWALGYHQPYVYYVPEWRLTRDGETTAQPGGRFRLETTHEDTGEWSWRDNDFLHTRPMAGLFVLMVMVNNWDVKAEQNVVYEVRDDNGRVHRQYVVKDLGASLGQTGWWFYPTSKDDLEAFEREPFVRGVEGNRVQFHYQGGWLEPQLHESVTPQDVQWVCALLARLSDRQWHDAFRAGGFDEQESERYIRRLKQKVAEGLSLAGDRIASDAR